VAGRATVHVKHHYLLCAFRHAHQMARARLGVKDLDNAAKLTTEGDLGHSSKHVPLCTDSRGDATTTDDATNGAFAAPAATCAGLAPCIAVSTNGSDVAFPCSTEMEPAWCRRNARGRGRSRCDVRHVSHGVGRGRRSLDGFSGLMLRGCSARNAGVEGFSAI
jgi:hypothetical protein